MEATSEKYAFEPEVFCVNRNSLIESGEVRCDILVRGQNGALYLHPSSTSYFSEHGSTISSAEDKSGFRVCVEEDEITQTMRKERVIFVFQRRGSTPFHYYRLDNKSSMKALIEAVYPDVSPEVVHVDPFGPDRGVSYLVDKDRSLISAEDGGVM